MNIAIILSGGTGSRLGTNIPKQYLTVGTKPIISYSLETFAARADISAIVVVCASEWQSMVSELAEKIGKPVLFALPGETRQHSIYNGLKVCRINGTKDDDIVIIHDAARPLVSDDIINECIEGCRIHDGVLPVIRIKDTVYYSEDGVEIKGLLNRSQIYAGQAPESFVFGKYIRLHDKLSYDDISKITGSTEIAYKGGLHVKLAKGDEMNFKITTLEDLKAFESIVDQKISR